MFAEPNHVFSIATEHRIVESCLRDIQQEQANLIALESALHLMEESDGAFTPFQVQMLDIVAQRTGAKLGHQTAGVGLESYTGYRGRQVYRLTMEGFKETAQKTWEKIKQLFEQIWAALKRAVEKLLAWIQRNDVKKARDSLKKRMEEDPKAQLTIKLPEHIVAADVGGFNSFSQYDKGYIKRSDARQTLAGHVAALAEHFAKEGKPELLDVNQDIGYLQKTSEAIARCWHAASYRIGTYDVSRLVTEVRFDESTKPSQFLTQLGQALHSTTERWQSKNDEAREIQVRIDVLVHGLSDMESVQAALEREVTFVNKKLDESGRNLKAALEHIRSLYGVVGLDHDKEKGAQAIHAINEHLGVLRGALHLTNKVDAALITDLGREGHVLHAICQVIQHAAGVKDE